MNWKQTWMNFHAWMLGQKKDDGLEAGFLVSKNDGAIREVMGEWGEAYALWQMISDPDLIDAAIFRINAAEKQYMYLMKQEASYVPLPHTGQIPRWLRIAQKSLPGTDV